MPISLRPTYSGGWEARHTFTHPAVYLDHWAMRAFSENGDLGTRLLEAIRKTNGTLCLTHLSAVEFSKADDARHAKDAEAFFDAAMASLYLVELDFDKAIAAEEQLGPGNTRPPPDVETVQLLTDRLRHTSGQLTFTGLVQAVASSRDEIAITFAESNQAIVAMVARERANPKFVAKALNSDPGSDPHTPISPTKILFGELLRNVVIDATAQFTANDAADLQHTTIPSAYCDFILLDKRWEHFLNVATERIAARNLPFRPAKGFSRRRNGIEKFLVALESWPN